MKSSTVAPLREKNDKPSEHSLVALDENQTSTFRSAEPSLIRWQANGSDVITELQVGPQLHNHDVIVILKGFMSQDMK